VAHNSVSDNGLTTAPHLCHHILPDTSHVHIIDRAEGRSSRDEFTVSGGLDKGRGHFQRSDHEASHGWEPFKASSA
jgi:hypothetical protein